MTNPPAHPEPVPEPTPDPDPPQPIPGADVDAVPNAAPPPVMSEMSAPTGDIPTVVADTPDVWHQPKPSEPFHARHEKPGEWRFEPPEHLAFEHSPPAEVIGPTHHDDTTHLVDDTAHLVPVPAPAWEIPLTPDDADRRRRGGLWISVALTATLLLCGGGAASAYLLLRDSDAKGAPDPASAVDEFMTAVYTRQDAGAAEDLVCDEARDAKRLGARVDQIKGYSAEYDAPSFRWADPAVDSQNDDRATVSVELTMSTDDEKTAQQQLTFTTIRKTGWLVCEISG